jgi:hypothetical protein
MRERERERSQDEVILCGWTRERMERESDRKRRERKSRVRE